METVFAGVDLGGTKIAAALGHADGRVLHSKTIPTLSGEGPERVLARIVELVNGLAAEGGPRPAALGIGVPGLVDSRTGFIRFLPNLEGQWRGVAAGAFLEHALGMPVRILNDARCAAFSELLRGHGRLYPSFVLFTLGTGIGGGIVIDGKLRLGPLSAAGEIGHQTMMANGPLCGCGNDGCLEAIASGPAIARAAGCVNAAEAAGAARNGDVRAQRAFREAAMYLGIAAANLVTALHPDAILFSGGMAELADLLLMPVRAAINERVRMFPADGVAVRRAAAGPQAGLLGALALHAESNRLGF
ncbi:MAG: ROK family protein [Acidobacteria bacterium]|nr:ROK family protein [Acidobacteriota bacterium]